MLTVIQGPTITIQGLSVVNVSFGYLIFSNLGPTIEANLELTLTGQVSLAYTDSSCIFQAVPSVIILQIGLQT